MNEVGRRSIQRWWLVEPLQLDLVLFVKWATEERQQPESMAAYFVRQFCTVRP
ncbi:MAG: hypothetical protein IT301_10770 [Dehalococcoidia bacterium]|nr:hypothetical protein [Dehalococcoidia bacterium]